MPPWVIDTIEDNSGDLILPFPKELTDMLDWRPGDVLEFAIDGDAVTIINKSKNDREAGCNS